MSPDLIAFLKAWHEWAINGAPDAKPFYRAVGLCTNLSFFDDDVIDELLAMFDDDHPFGFQEYTYQQMNKTMHECPKRLAWVRERLIEAGELVA